MSGAPRHLWEAFERAVSSRGEAPALILREGDVSFAQLRADAERAALWLAAQGARKGDIVALQLPKRRATYALWLACLRQGCPYVFMDPRNPPPRDASILARLTPRVFVSVSDTANPHGAALRLAGAEDAAAWLEALPQGAPEPARLEGADPAYVMFTSGSTGEPKGAVIPHRGVLSLMRWARAFIAGPEGAVFSNINPLHFDNAVFDLYGGLVNGAALAPVETSESANPALWARRLRDAGANVIFAVPTLFQTLDRLKLLRPETLPAARVFVFGGEGFPAAHLAEFFARFKGRARLVNVYGPTETSCICSSLEIDEAALAAAGAGFPSLGRMHEDFDHAVLDDAGRRAAPGKPGELWIGGGNVGLGYFNNREETARRFAPAPHLPGGGIWYRSGDLVREDAGGLLWFLGRVDNQVKVRGHRIELEEIDLALEAFPGVKRALTVAAQGPDGAELRAAFTASGAVEIEALRAACAQKLPPYMRPAVLRQMDALPQNANGKADRRAVARLLEQP